MPYVRKTRDVYHVQGNYGCGYETECTEDNRKEARQRLKEYQDNGPGVYRLVKRRERLEVAP